MTEQAYIELLDENIPLLNKISNGYTYEEADNLASFKVEAESALEKLSFINIDGVEIVDDRDVALFFTFVKAL